MSFNPRHALAAAVLASLVMAGCNRNDAEVDTTADSGVNPPAANEPVTPLPPAEPFPNTGTTPGADTALDVSSVTLGTAAGADLSITNPTSSFGTGDPIVVSVATNGAASNAEVTVRLKYQDGQQAGEESESNTTTGAETTNFTFENTDPWPTGSYTAEVWINGTQAETSTFTVR